MKNISTYVLAQSSNTYAQYIADASEERFKVALTLCDSPSQLLIQREGNLMYYLYVRQHSSQERFGLCVVANGMMATDLERVFEVFEQSYESIVLKGKILDLDKSGNVFIASYNFAQVASEIDAIRRKLQEGLMGISGNIPLPPPNYASSYTDRRMFTLATLTDEQLAQTTWYGWTLIRKQGNIESELFASIRQRLATLSEREMPKIKRSVNPPLSTEEEEIPSPRLTLIILIILGIALTFPIAISIGQGTTSEQYSTDTVYDLVDSTILDSTVVDSVTFAMDSIEADSIDSVDYTTLSPESMPLNVVVDSLDSVGYTTENHPNSIFSN